MDYKDVDSIEKVYAANNLDITKKPDVSSFPEEFQEYMANHFDTVLIARAINKNEDGTFWIPDYSPGNSEPKYELWVDMTEYAKDPSGSGFAYCVGGYWSASSNCGSRLCFKSKDRAYHAFEKFPKQYRINMFVIKSVNEHTAIPEVKE